MGNNNNANSKLELLNDTQGCLIQKKNGQIFINSISETDFSLTENYGAFRFSTDARGHVRLYVNDNEYEQWSEPDVFVYVVNSKNNSFVNEANFTASKSESIELKRN